jgi:Domain of unknown function (DUF397)
MLRRSHVRGGKVEPAGEGDLADALRSAPWRKSRFSNPSGECVEFTRLPRRRVAVRDSKNPQGPVLIFTPGEWEGFLAAIRGGRVH